MPDLSLEAQIKCIMREVLLRERMYPKWVANGKMQQVDADLQMLLIREVLFTLKQARAHG